MRILIMSLTAFALLGALPASAADPATTAQSVAGGVAVGDAWARASAGAASMGAAYVTLKGGSADDRLVSVSTPVAPMAQVHESAMEGGMMRMRPVPSLAVPAGKTVALAPGGYHVMLMGLKQPLKAGESFPLTLHFEHAGAVTVDVAVRAIGATTAGGHDQMKMQ